MTKEAEKQIIVVTGASSGFGEMTAYALADAGHTVYASMRALVHDRRATSQQVWKASYGLVPSKAPE
ncbi:hypothetical protein [Tateyamaria sp. SN3-11]|uniref:hypothetical protein n=1 Tax=Tateyamaria sp. SN3-11 TaxID=3092147 RepID=UPI0039E75917